MKPVDIEQFWKDDRIAHEENCFSKKSPQVALGIRMSDECVFAELGEEGNPWGHTPRGRRIDLNKRYNDKAEKIVGIRLLNENFPENAEYMPSMRGIGEVFGGEYVFDGNTTWLKGSCSTTAELEKMLGRVDSMDMKEFILPENWYSEKKRLFEKNGTKPGLWRGVRGPVTLATSVFGTENLLYLYYDAPELFKRFSNSILNVIKKYISIANEEAGYTDKNAPRGFGFADDDSNLLTPEMYEEFGYPILKSIFEMCSPDKNDSRYQHSDSAMGHLLPLLGELDMNGCNFGPTVMIRDIRKFLPNARIDGQLAPFTFMRNNEDDIIAEVKRDCEMAKEGDFRGVNLTTAGSINNGSLLTSMRAVMYAIQTYGRY